MFPVSAFLLSLGILRHSSAQLTIQARTGVASATQNTSLEAEAKASMPSSTSYGGTVLPKYLAPAATTAGAFIGLS